MLDAGCWLLDTGYSMLDTGCKRSVAQANNRWFRAQGKLYMVEGIRFRVKGTRRRLRAHGAGPKNIKKDKILGLMPCALCLAPVFYSQLRYKSINNSER